MPYIPPEDRPAIDPSINWLIRDLNTEEFSAAALNYAMCRLANAYIQHHGLRYNFIKDVQGVFHGAAREFDARVADPYEVQKIEDNGTVWDCTDEPPTEDLTDEYIESLMIHDRTTGQHWMKCYEGDCDLHLVGPGKVVCENCDQKIDSDYQQGEQ